MTIDVASRMIDSVIDDLQVLRDNWEQLLNEAKLVASSLGIIPEFRGMRSRKRKRHLDEPDTEVMRSPEENFRYSIFNPTVDVLLAEIEDRAKSLRHVNKLFEALLIPDPNDETISNCAKQLARLYSVDLDEEELRLEMIQYASLRSRVYHLKEDASALHILNSIYKVALEPIFPQICICRTTHSMHIAFNRSRSGKVV